MLKNRIGSFFAGLLSVTLSYCFAYWMRFHNILQGRHMIGREGFQNALVVILFAYILVFLFYERGEPKPKESKSFLFSRCIAFNAILTVTLIVLFYLLHFPVSFSRLLLLYFVVTDIVLMFLGNLLVQGVGKRYRDSHKRELVVFANEANSLKVLNKLLHSDIEDFEISGIAVCSKSGSRFYKFRREDGRSYIDDSFSDTWEFLRGEVVDQALISLPDSSKGYMQNLIRKLEEMGIDSYLTVNSFAMGITESRIEKFGCYRVLTYSPRIFSEKELLAKRTLDIIGGLIGCALCLIIGLFVAPAIYIEDPGPVIFKQRRVGTNGRYFYIYKFRSMYQDAEERKKELMAKNEMNGLMFKMKDDPRITKVGKFIRKTSLDEFPQFFNVLKGDMSLVGTRPPTVDEFKHYSNHHKRRLSLKPGITGLWQVSGRSEITDFEEIVRLDLEYIDNWSFKGDIKILLKTVGVVFSKKGSE